MFELKQKDYEKILDHARKNLPEEACGLITGVRKNQISTADEVYLLENSDHSAEHFTISPEDQLKVLKQAREKGQDVIAVWHSHPATPSRMSDEDIRLARDESRSYLILSLADSEPVLHSFRMQDGKVQKEELKIIQEVRQS